MKKALVTGATGFIGSHLVSELVKRGFEVTCLIRTTSNLRWLNGLEVNFVYGDCSEKDSLKRLPSDVDYIFHLAGLTKAKKEEDFYMTNVNGTENLLSCLSRNASGIRRFLFLSSLAAAGPSWDGMPLDESAPPRPVSAYGKSKLEGEGVLSGYKDRLPVSVIRPPAVYGPRDRDFFLFYRMIQRGFYPYWGKCYYSLLYVDDLVHGMIAAAESGETEGKTYFLTDSRVYSNDEIVFEIMEAMGKRAMRIGIPASAMKLLAKLSEKLAGGASIINSDKLREIKHHHWTCDPKKAGLEFGFIPKVSIKEGIKWTADWYKIHKWL